MKKYGLIGKNISYSFSEKYFSEKFAREGISDCSYRIFDIQDIENVKDILADSDICGLNVTIPYKVEIMSLLDEISDEARQIGAVNTVKVSPDGHLSGYNSDVYGFMRHWLRFWRAATSGRLYSAPAVRPKLLLTYLTGSA